MTSSMIAVILILFPLGCLANILVYSDQGLRQIPHINMSETMLDFTNNSIQMIGPDDFISDTEVQVSNPLESIWYILYGFVCNVRII